MSRLTLNTPQELQDVFTEISTLPYYQVGTDYKPATHLLFDDVIQTSTQSFLDTETEDSTYNEWKTGIRSTIEQLESLNILKSDLDKWILNKELAGTMIEYQNIIDNLLANITLFSYLQTTNSHIDIDEEENRIILNYSRYYIANLSSRQTTRQSGATNYVLNRNNPFADISIKDQQFIFASDYNRFNSLELNTSHTLTRVQKNEDQSFIALQPGFKIRKTSDIGANIQSDISFDDTLSTEIAQNDDHIYVYVDINDILTV